MTLAISTDWSDEPEAMVHLVAERQAAWEARCETYPALRRALFDSRDRPAWLLGRTGKIGASDAASFSKVTSAPLYLKAKLNPSFHGNTSTQHGNDREPFILAAYNLEQNFTLFASADNPRHVATPDSIILGAGELTLSQVKTTVKDLYKIPPTYQRQMLWEQYVMGADRTLFIWEKHTNYVPDEMEPVSQWFYRDDIQIAKLVTIANLVLTGMDEAEAFRKDLQEQL